MKKEAIGEEDGNNAYGKKGKGRKEKNMALMERNSNGGLKKKEWLKKGIVGDEERTNEYSRRGKIGEERHGEEEEGGAEISISNKMDEEEKINTNMIEGE